MKKDNSKKITTLGVVIFSFISIGICFLAMLIVGLISIVLVLKTSLPEETLMIGSVIGSGIGTVSASYFLAIKGRIKGIYSALIITAALIFLKFIGRMLPGIDGTIGWSNIVGILFVIVFSLVGGAIGSLRKR